MYKKGYLGTYDGINCYEITQKEFVDNKLYEFKDGLIYIIKDDHGVMVRNNRIIGYYNGRTVEKVNQENVYMLMMPPSKKAEVERSVENATKTSNAFLKMFEEKVEEKPKPKKKRKATPQVKSMTYEEVVAHEIVFSDYSKVVDEFFRNLGKE